MKIHPARTLVALSLLLVLAHPALGAPAEPAASGSGGAPGPVVRAEKAVTHGAQAAAGGVEHGAKAAANGVEHGAKSAAGGVERGAKATANGVERGLNAAARGIERGAKATADTVKSVSSKMGGTASSSAPAAK
jgi:hypothetical protein